MPAAAPAERPVLWAWLFAGAVSDGGWEVVDESVAVEVGLLMDLVVDSLVVVLRDVDVWLRV
jgi:hypothetical protein